MRTNTFHRTVFRRQEQLIANRIHHYRITNLRNAVTFQGAAPDPVMHIVASDGRILTENDDFTGLASEIIFIPMASEPATVIIRAFNTKRLDCVISKKVSTVHRQLPWRQISSFGE